jgi:hypothetical protein
VLAGSGSAIESCGFEAKTASSSILSAVNDAKIISILQSGTELLRKSYNDGCCTNKFISYTVFLRETDALNNSSVQSCSTLILQ